MGEGKKILFYFLDNQSLGKDVLVIACGRKKLFFNGLAKKHIVSEKYRPGYFLVETHFYGQAER